MKEEIKSAADFLTNILRNRDEVNEAQTKHFNSSLCELLCTRFQNHWFPEKPFKGSGYRCIRLNHNMDPLMLQAGRMCGLDQAFLESTFPRELTIWVDPKDVSFRIGENGSVGILYESTTQQQQPSFTESYHTVNSHHQQMSRNFNLMSCKDQFVNSLPSLAREAVSYKHLAGFVAS